MEITLLADHPHEAKNIAQWYYSEWAHAFPNMTINMVLEKVVEKSGNRPAIPLAIVAHEDRELVGVVELKYRENANYPQYEIWLGGVFVDYLSRGRGIGGLLISEAKSKAVSLGIQQLYLQCETHNIALYKKHGFKALHQANHHEIVTTIMRWVAAI